MAYLFHNEKVIDWSSWLKNLKPRPLVDHNFYRLWYLVVLVLLQDFIIPDIVGPYFCFNLLTVWLIIHFVHFKPWPSISLGVVACLLLETHSSLPTGLYFATYWFIGVFVVLLRRNISWINTLPWLCTIALSELILITLEQLAHSSLTDIHPFQDKLIILELTGRIVLTCCFGFWLLRRYRLYTFEE